MRRRSAALALRQEEKVELEKVLTTAQKARLKELRAAAAKPKDAPRDKDAPSRPEKDSLPPKDKDR